MKSCTCYRHKSTPLPANATPAPFLARKGEDERIRTANPQPPPTLDRGFNERSTRLRAATRGPHQCNTARGPAPVSAQGTLEEISRIWTGGATPPPDAAALRTRHKVRVNVTER